MTVIILDQASHQYLQSVGLDSATDNGNWDQAANSVRQQLYETLSTGAYINPAAVNYLIDYCSGDHANIDNTGTGSYNGLPDALGALLYQAGNVYGGATFSQSLVSYYLNNVKGAITPELAPLLCDPTFVPTSADSWYHGSTGETEINANLNAGLANGLKANPQVAPPALAIQTLGQSTVSGQTFQNPDDPSGPALTPTQAACNYAKDYFNYAAANGKPIDPALIDAYVAIDPDPATDIGNIIDANMQSNGSVDADLMAAYLKLNPNGPGGPSSGNPGSFPALDTTFDSNPPTVAGWAWVAMNSLIKQSQAQVPLDATMLQNLDSVSPWAGTYVRYEALNAEIANHENLNNDYLKALAVFNPAVAASVCNRELQDALQPTNTISTWQFYAYQWSDSGGSNTDRLTNVRTPTVQVDLNGMGTPPPAVGDIVSLTAQNVWGTSTMALGSPQAAGSSAALTQADIDAGYVDITVPTQDALSTDGNWNITSSFTHNVTNATGQVTSTYTSPSSTPLNITLKTTAPPPPTSATWSYDSTTGNVNVILNLPQGVAPNSPSLNDWSIDFNAWSNSVDFGALHPTNVVVDAAAGKILLSCSPAQGWPGTNAPWVPSAGISVSYTNNNSGYVDAAGNALASFGSLSANNGTVPGVTATPLTFYTPPPARAMDQNAYAFLNGYSPSQAQQWQTRFATAGLLPPSSSSSSSSSSSGSSSSGSSGSSTDIQSLMWTAYTSRLNGIQDLLTQQFNTVQTQNASMSNLTNLLGAMNALEAELPSNAGTGDNLSNDLATKWGSLSSAINDAITAANATGLFGTSNALTSSNTKGDLDRAIQTVKAQVDASSTTNQTNYLELQQTVASYNLTIQLISSLLDMFKQTGQTVDQHM